MADACCAGGNDVMILACSGGSNVGQLNFNLARSDVDRVKAAIKRVVNEGASAKPQGPAGGCGCACSS